MMLADSWVVPDRRENRGRVTSPCKICSDQLRNSYEYSFRQVGVKCLCKRCNHVMRTHQNALGTCQVGAMTTSLNAAIRLDCNIFFFLRQAYAGFVLTSYEMAMNIFQTSGC